MLKKRGEYAEAKKVLREKQIKFQTPYPAKMQVFYDDNTRLYQDTAEATRDMASRGLSECGEVLCWPGPRGDPAYVPQLIKKCR